MHQYGLGMLEPPGQDSEGPKGLQEGAPLAGEGGGTPSHNQPSPPNSSPQNPALSQNVHQRRARAHAVAELARLLADPRRRGIEAAQDRQQHVRGVATR